MNAQRLCIFLLSGLLLMLMSACSTVTTVDGQALQRNTLTFKGLKRDYLIYSPSVVSSSEKLPVVLVLHGGGGDAEGVAKTTGFVAKARKAHFIAVFPNGVSRGKFRPKTWNVGHCCAFAMRKNIDDPGFISAVIDQVVRDYPADSQRIFVTGMSNGAMLSHRVGIELSDKVAGIASVAGALFGDESEPAHPVSALMINGAIDETVPPAGGPLGRFASGAGDGTDLKPSLYQSEFWAKVDGCQSEPVLSKPKHLVQELDYICPFGISVRQYMVNDNGHAWPDGKKGGFLGDTPSNAMNATDVIWEFFSGILPKQ